MWASRRLVQAGVGKQRGQWDSAGTVVLAQGGEAAGTRGMAMGQGRAGRAVLDESVRLIWTRFDQGTNLRYEIVGDRTDPVEPSFLVGLRQHEFENLFVR